MRIARWSVENMQDPAGFFYHQRHERFINRIIHALGASLMMRALASLAAAVPCR